MYDEMYNWKDGSAERFEDMTVRFLHLYHQLARGSIRANPQWLAWRWFPKFHMLLHICRQAYTMGNPKSWWCYADESAIGFAVDVAESVHVLTCSGAVMSKCIVWLEISEG